MIRRLVTIQLIALMIFPFMAKGASEVEPVTVPLEVADKVPFVMVSVDGKEPCLFIVDTGATETIITPRAADALGVTIAKTGSGQERANLRSLAVGEAEVSNLQVLVFDPPQAVSLRLDRGMDYCGILGYTFLRQFVTSIDYSAKELSLTPIRKVRPKPIKKIKEERPSGSVIPFRVQERLIHVEAEIDGKEKVRMLVDTGAAELVIMPSAARKMKLRTTPLKDMPGVCMCRLNKVAVGASEVKDIEAVVHVPSQDRLSETTYDGIIGYPFLSNYLLTINYRELVLILDKPEERETE